MVTSFSRIIVFADPAVLLKDPRAMDQDNDSRIADAVENGFVKQTKGRWRSRNPPNR